MISQFSSLTALTDLNLKIMLELVNSLNQLKTVIQCHLAFIYIYIFFFKLHGIFKQKNYKK